MASEQAVAADGFSSSLGIFTSIACVASAADDLGAPAKSSEKLGPGRATRQRVVGPDQWRASCRGACRAGVRVMQGCVSCRGHVTDGWSAERRPDTARSKRSDCRRAIRPEYQKRRSEELVERCPIEFWIIYVNHPRLIVQAHADRSRRFKSRGTHAASDRRPQLSGTHAAGAFGEQFRVAQLSGHVSRWLTPALRSCSATPPSQVGIHRSVIHRSAMPD